AVVREAHPVALTAPARLTGTVLVVEDNLVNQKVARRYLERMGLTVTIAADGAEGVQVFASARFDAILMDVQMPILDGYAATERIRALERDLGRHTPIIALTADAMSGQTEKCLLAGMDDFLSKPIDAHRLEQ